MIDDPLETPNYPVWRDLRERLSDTKCHQTLLGDTLYEIDYTTHNDTVLLFRFTYGWDLIHRTKNANETIFNEIKANLENYIMEDLL